MTRPRKYDWKLIAKLYKQGKNLREIAAIIGSSAVTVRNALKEMGVKRRRPGQPFKQINAEVPDDEKIKKLYLDGWSLREIGKKVGIGHQAVLNSLNRSKTPTRRQHPMKQKVVVDTKLPRDLQVQQLYLAGWSQQAIADLFELGTHVISASLKRTNTPIRRGPKKG